MPIDNGRDDRLEWFLQRTLGPCRLAHDSSWPHGGSRVLAVTAADGTTKDGTTAYVKQHSREENYRRELRAYRDWVPALGDRAPRLLGHDDRLRVLVLSVVPGSMVAGETAGPEVHRAAGELLRRLHDAAAPTPWPDFAAEKQAALERWAPLADGILDRRELEFARAELRTLDGFPAPDRVPCHLDFSPRNWLLAGDRLGVIDFEWAHWEIWVNDLARLYFGPWRARPELRAAFFDGYGRRPTADEEAVLMAGYTLDAVWMRIWAVEHGERDFAEAQREILRALMSRKFV